MSFWQTDWHSHGFQGYDSAPALPDSSIGLLTGSAANSAQAAGNDLMPLDSWTVSDGELIIGGAATHRAQSHNGPTAGQQHLPNLDGQQGPRIKRSVKIKGKRPEAMFPMQPHQVAHALPQVPQATRQPITGDDWALPASNEHYVGAALSDITAKPDKLSGALPMRVQTPQPSGNTESTGTLSRKVKLKSKQGIRSHSGVPASTPHDNLAQLCSSSSAFEGPVPIDSTSRLPGKVTGHHAAMTVPHVTDLMHPSVEALTASPAFGSTEQLAARPDVGAQADAHPLFDDIFGDSPMLGPLSPGKFDAAADPEPNKVTPEFIDQWFASPRLSDLLCSSPAAPSPLNGSSALMAELHQLVSTDSAPKGNQIPAPAGNAGQWAPKPGVVDGSAGQFTVRSAVMGRGRGAGACGGPLGPSGPKRLGGIHGAPSLQTARRRPHAIDRPLPQRMQNIPEREDNELTVSDQSDRDDAHDSDWFAGVDSVVGGESNATAQGMAAGGDQWHGTAHAQHMQQGAWAVRRGSGRGRGRGRGRGGGRGRRSLVHAREVSAAALEQRKIDEEAAKQYEAEVHERFLVAKGYYEARKLACTLAQSRLRAAQVRERAKQLKTVLSVERRTKDVMKWHKAQQSQKSKEQSARLNALRRQDYSEYLRLAEEAKAGRVQDAIDATERVMLALTEKVLEQQAARGEPASSPLKPPPPPLPSFPLGSQPDCRTPASSAAGPSSTAPCAVEGPGAGSEGGAGASAVAVQAAVRGDEKGSATECTLDSVPTALQPAHERYFQAVHSVTLGAEHWEGLEQPPSLSEGCTLRPYQTAGVRFLFSLYRNGINGILADEMGLGKTVQALALLAAVAQHERRWGPYLVVAPKAVLSNWAKEAKRWLPASCVTVMYDGPGEERKALQRTFLKGTSFNLLLTHYHIVISDRPALSKIQWAVVIVDEGHRLKNEQSRLAGALTALPTRARFLLTGTPLQNRLGELWALLHFLLPTVFASSASFDDWFGLAFSGKASDLELSEEEQLLIINRLHNVLRPLMLRRTKAEVAGELPDKTERIVRCGLSPWQAALYRSITSSRNMGDTRGRTVFLSNLTMHLRKVCLHPGLMYDDYEPESPRALIAASGKLAVLHNILPKLQLAGHRVLLFSQFTSCLDLIQASLEDAVIPHLRLDGTTKTHERAEALDAFNATDSPYFVFLLSTRAGGLGLNLQTADTVIIFDQDWNPQVDLQAKDRAHRLGQQRQVMVLVMVCAGTVEEVILETTERKLSLDAKVIQAGLFNEASSAADRQRALQQVLQTTPPASTDRSETEETSAINALISRSSEEQALFERIDGHIASMQNDKNNSSMNENPCKIDYSEPARPLHGQQHDSGTLPASDMHRTLQAGGVPGGGSGTCCAGENGGDGSNMHETYSHSVSTADVKCDEAVGRGRTEAPASPFQPLQIAEDVKPPDGGSTVGCPNEPPAPGVSKRLPPQQDGGSGDVPLAEQEDAGSPEEPYDALTLQEEIAALAHSADPAVVEERLSRLQPHALLQLEDIPDWAQDALQTADSAATADPDPATALLPVPNDCTPTGDAAAERTAAAAAGAAGGACVRKSSRKRKLHHQTLAGIDEMQWWNDAAGSGCDSDSADERTAEAHVGGPEGMCTKLEPDTAAEAGEKALSGTLQQAPGDAGQCALDPERPAASSLCTSDCKRPLADAPACHTTRRSSRGGGVQKPTAVCDPMAACTAVACEHDAVYGGPSSPQDDSRGAAAAEDGAADCIHGAHDMLVKVEDADVQLDLAAGVCEGVVGGTKATPQSSNGCVVAAGASERSEGEDQDSKNGTPNLGQGRDEPKLEGSRKCLGGEKRKRGRLARMHSNTVSEALRQSAPNGNRSAMAGNQPGSKKNGKNANCNDKNAKEANEVPKAVPFSKPEARGGRRNAGVMPSEEDMIAIANAQREMDEEVAGRYSRPTRCRSDARRSHASKAENSRGAHADGRRGGVASAKMGKRGGEDVAEKTESGGTGKLARSRQPVRKSARQAH